jgi:hypothetical protein
MSKGKVELHQILAVEGDLQGKSQKIIEETVKTFNEKQNLFYGFIKRYEPYEETGQKMPEEFKEIDDTVPSKLKYAVASFVKYLDVIATKEATNAVATAPLVINGEVIHEALPATLLLALENKLRGIRPVLEAMPTLTKGIEWIPAPDRGEDIYVTAKPDIKQRTVKEPKFRVLYDATKEHPAQIEKWMETVAVGDFISTQWSGNITSAEKARILERFDEVLRAIKKARMKANSTEVVKVNVAKSIFDYVVKGK